MYEHIQIDTIVDNNKRVLQMQTKPLNLTCTCRISLLLTPQPLSLSNNKDILLLMCLITIKCDWTLKNQPNCFTKPISYIF